MQSGSINRQQPQATGRFRSIFAWALLLSYVGFIYATLGVVPKWREALVDSFGEGVYAALTYGAAGVIVLVILSYMIFKKRETRVLPYLILIAILLSLYHVLRHWITIPVEQIHFVEYGVMGFLSYNALKRHLRGWGLATAALLLTYLIGMGDECIQGNLANRVGEQRDMYWNGLAGLLGLALVVFCLKPVSVRGKSGRTEARAHLLTFAALLPLQVFFNLDIAQFGVLIEDGVRGVEFKSRLQPERLRAYRDNLPHFKREIAPRLGKVRTYLLLGKVHDRIHEEALVHSFRREHYFRVGNLLVAYKEHLILDEYFPQFIEGTDLDWQSERIAEMQRLLGDLAFSVYRSPVAQHLIVSYTKTQMWVAFAILEGLAIFLFLRLYRKRRLGG